MNTRILTLFALVLLTLVAPTPGHSRDRVILNTGEVFVGKLLRSDNKEVAIQLENGGTITFHREIVKEVREDPEAVAARRGLQALLRPPRPVKGSTTPKKDKRPFSVNKRPSTPTGALRMDLLEPIFEDAKAGFSFHPPKGLQQELTVQQAGMIAAFQDSVTRTNLTVFKSTLDSTLNKLREEVKERFADREIVRDAPLGSRDLKGWLLEMRSRVGGIDVRQTQVYVKQAKNIFVLTYTTLEKHNKMYYKSFNESIRSIVVRRQ